ncbi:MAG: Hpt domain-containing protein [Gracilimonas sp.]|uniref:Hpt domain-containing protein n=1 Tax=Gracilimonas TaxID=649462 RepID=UPI001B16080F|nr:Hpt domain-containing protein [Gracilimonas sp.]MBO6585670.1 Hpt domain-containing protein [Gracilimonas sp.]MBO6616667.1 Hpt domain-containing protein [Gracilimonas sp.]
MGKIDLSYLENITGGDNEVMVEMIDLMLSETPKHIDKIKKAHQEEHWKELGAESHKLKPMFLYVGLTALNEIAQDLEKFGKETINLKSIPGLIDQLEQGYLEVVDDLKNKKQELS